MTCDEYTRLVLTRSWTELNEGDALAHARDCTRCTGLREDAERAQTRLAHLMSAARPSIHPAVLADRAIVGARLRTIERGLLIIPALIIVLVLWLALRGLPGSTVELLTGRRPLPTLTTETIALRCLAADQADALARPYLTGPGSRMTSGTGSISTLTVTGTAEAVKLAKEVVERFESHPNAACRRR
jgi:hypothetical protein